MKTKSQIQIPMRRLLPLAAQMPLCVLTAFVGSLILLAGACSLKASTETWTGGGSDNLWSDANNWSGVNATPQPGDTPTFGTVGAGGATLNNDIPSGSYLGLTFNASTPSFTLNGNSITTTNGIVDNSPNLEIVNLPIVLGADLQSVNVANSAGSLLLGGVIDDGGNGYGITTTGGGTVTLTNNNTYTGTTTVNAGTLKLDFNAAGAADNIVSSSSALAFGGGTLTINGNASSVSSQTGNGTTFSSGANVISVAPASGSTVPNLALGALTYDAGATVEFIGPTNDTSATTSTGQPGAYGSGTTTGVVPATANITTTSGAADQMLYGGMTGVTDGSGVANVATFATVGLYDYAFVTGTSPFTVTAASQDAVPGVNWNGGSAGSGCSSGTDGAYVLCNAGQLGGSKGSYGGPYDIVGTCAGHNTDSDIALRFNAAGAGGFSGSGTVSVGGILVTPNVGANNITINYMNIGLRNGSYAGSLVVWQNNVSGFMLCGGLYENAKHAGSGYVQAGPGTVSYNAANPSYYTYTGPTWLNGGVTEITIDAELGAAATAATVTLNGGTVLGNATFALDNAGANQRPVALGNNGGGLAAVSGYTMTVDGVVSGAAGTGPLTIGIPALSANGNVAGLVPGTGSGTANTTPVNATGTVALTAPNTYTGGTIVLAGGILNINGIYALGGANYGGLTLNNGTLQYAASFSGNGSGDLTSIGTAGITLAAGGGTIDVNGNTVTYAGSIGNGGSGALAVASTVLGGVLNLGGANTYTGNTTISGGTLNANNTSGSATGSGNVTVASGATLGGTGTISGSVNWQSGSFASFTKGSPLTVGVVTLHGNSLTVNVPGVTPLGVGSYTLMNYTAAGSTGAFNTGTPTIHRRERCRRDHFERFHQRRGGHVDNYFSRCVRRLGR